jgi:hypothetical protein
MYVAPIANITAAHNVNHAQYADDTQLYISLEGNGSVSAINDCFLTLRRWFDSNGLSLNPDKSEAIIIGTAARHRSEGAIEAVTLGDVIIPTSDDVRSLGITIDHSLSFSKHIDITCKAASYHVRALRHIRKFISADDAMTIATAMVSSRLDYCNSLLYGTSTSNINKLQRIQNTVARVVTCTSRQQHIAPILADLHWLPVSSRIDYKLALLTYKTLSTQTPNYLFELLHFNQPARQLRSSINVANKLFIPRTSIRFADRAFSHAAPVIWNSLPARLTTDLSRDISVFRRELKTHFYRQSFAN